jgi:hypothetical protein
VTKKSEFFTQIWLSRQVGNLLLPAAAHFPGFLAAAKL